MARVYLVPKIGDGQSPDTAFRPKYTDLDSLGAGWNLNGRWTSLDYGAENLFMLVAQVTAEEHTLLNAQTDVLAVPDLDNQVSGPAIPVIESKLEAANLPGDWVNTSMTYRQVCKRVRKIVSFMQRYFGEYADSIFAGGLTLDTRINQIPQARRQRMATVAGTLGLDTSGLGGTTTIRQALRILADQIGDATIGGEDL